MSCDGLVKSRSLPYFSGLCFLFPDVCVSLNVLVSLSSRDVSWFSIFILSDCIFVRFPVFTNDCLYLCFSSVV